MWCSRLLKDIPGSLLTGSTFPLASCSKVTDQTTTPNQFPANPLLGGHGDNFPGHPPMVNGDQRRTSVRGPICSTGSPGSQIGSTMANDTVRAVLHLAADDYHRIGQHLFDDGSCTEASGFLFVRHQPQAGQHIFVYLGWYPVPPDGYAVRNEFHFELTDEVRAQVIKHAHDLDASIVEVHSHGGSRPAAFSPSDHWGFREFVPHVWWRLKGAPI